MPLLNLTAEDAPSASILASSTQGKRRWYLYAPLAFAIFLILMPHPSFLLMLSAHYLKSHDDPVRFSIHLIGVYAMTLLAFTSLIVCVVRDPGSVTVRRKSFQRDREESEQALLHPEMMSPREIDDLWLKGLWCKQCRCARPERAHHCSSCGRCVLKMDHHCPWIGANCVGYRTYPAFIHFVFMCTLLSLYIACVAVAVIVSLVQDPASADPDVSPLHALFLTLLGAIFTVVMGSFFVYHAYLITIGQTTLEHMSPYHLLRNLPPPASSPKPPNFPPPPSGQHSYTASLADPPSPLSDWDSPVDDRTYPPRSQAATPTRAIASRYCPPEEHDLTHAQRRLVRYYHGRIRMYDLGWKRNWGEVFGGGRGRMWWRFIPICGGRPRGDGFHFEKARGIEERLQHFSNELEEMGRAERTAGHA